MDEAISSTNPPQENASGGILKKGDHPPREDAATRQPEAQHIVLQNREQPKMEPHWQPDDQREGKRFSHSCVEPPNQASDQQSDERRDQCGDQTSEQPVLGRASDSFIW